MTDQLQDAIRRALKTGGPCFTHFLDPAAAAEFFSATCGAGLESGSFGAATDAERAVCACWKIGCAPEEWPVRALKVSWDERAGELRHRDVLGAVLAAGISRDHVGDIRVGEGQAWLVLEGGVASFIEGSLQEVGRVAVRVGEAGEPLARPRGRERVVHVQSPRLDAVLAASLDLSRARAQELARSGKVSVNWREETRPDREVREGDMLSIRGQGRVRVGETTGVSRKGRSHMAVETFLS